jgi:hypothetical protein
MNNGSIEFNQAGIDLSGISSASSIFGIKIIGNSTNYDIIMNAKAESCHICNNTCRTIDLTAANVNDSLKKLRVISNIATVDIKLPNMLMFDQGIDQSHFISNHANRWTAPLALSTITEPLRIFPLLNSSETNSSLVTFSGSGVGYLTVANINNVLTGSFGGITVL